MAGGSAARMDEIMIDKLKGDTDKATSAMQGLAINLGERLTPSLRSATQGFTNIVSALSDFAKIGTEDLLKEEQLNVNKWAIELTNANTTLIRRNEIYEEIQDIAPDVIENIDIENVNIIDTFLLTMAMTALGMGTRFAKFKDLGLAPVFTAGGMLLWLVIGGFFITQWVVAIF